MHELKYHNMTEGLTVIHRNALKVRTQTIIRKRSTIFHCNYMTVFQHKHFFYDLMQGRNAEERKDRIQVYPSIALHFHKC